MSRILTFLLLISSLTIGCDTVKHRAEIERLRDELAEQKAQSHLSESEAKANRRKLVHLVWFNLKDELEEQERAKLINEIRKLNDIAQVQDLEIGKFCDLEDVRAMSDYELVMQMSFDSKEDYQTYQSHPVHLELKNQVKLYLNGAPVTYDYWTE